MRIIVAAAAMAAALAGCGPKPSEPATETPAATAPAAPAEEVAPAALTVPAPVAPGQDLLAGLAAGGSATVKTDLCPRSTPYDPAGKFGTIVCGESYVVFYEAGTGRWVAKGPNAALLAAKAPDPTSAAKNPGPAPDKRQVVIWGMNLMVMNPGNRLTLGDGTPVGHLVHSPQT